MVFQHRRELRLYVDVAEVWLDHGLRDSVLGGCYCMMLKIDIEKHCEKSGRAKMGANIDEHCAKCRMFTVALS